MMFIFLCLAFSVDEKTDPKLIRGYIALGSLMKVDNQRFVGLTKVIGLAMFVNRASKDFFTQGAKAGWSCSRQTIINMLDAMPCTIKPVYFFSLANMCLCYRDYYIVVVFVSA